ncbi:hypothetical protein D5S17_33650 [Pseudonocardiaceae bacterium YIM PH 21723]|nr:hypothetical protein D5S17_33650 [Pseudonocardiaceae bacterium YIM PH 21723]
MHLVLPDRDAAEELAGELRAEGWRPGTVHRDMLSGEDDAEDVDWVVRLEYDDRGSVAADRYDDLVGRAEEHDGFVSVVH